MRKGDASMIVVVIITLVVFLIMLTQLFPSWRKGLQKQTDFEGCSADLYLDAIEFRATQGTSLVEAGCTIDQVIITEESLKPYEALARKKKPPVSDVTEWAIKAAVAEEMRKCFDTVWQGKDIIIEALAGEAMREAEGVTLSVAFTPNNFGCIFCARIELEDSLKDKYPKSLDLWDWMNENNLYAGETYAVHFIKRNPGFYGSWLKGTSTFYTQRPMMVLFAAKYPFGSFSDAESRKTRGSVGLYDYQTVHTDLTTGLPKDLFKDLNLAKEKYGPPICGFSLGTL